MYEIYARILNCFFLIPVIKEKKVDINLIGSKRDVILDLIQRAPKKYVSCAFMVGLLNLTLRLGKVGPRILFDPSLSR